VTGKAKDPAGGSTGNGSVMLELAGREFEVTSPGEYPFECSFHLQLGQVGAMTVSA